MSLLNLSIPHTDAYVRPAFLFNLEQGHDDEPVPARVFGVASVAGRALGFHVLLEDGAVFWRLPVHALCWKTDAPLMAVWQLQLWDCFGDEVTYERFEGLDLSCTTHLPDGDGVLTGHEAEYIGTFDWVHNPYSETPEQHKCAHWLRLQNGNYALQPNNRIYPWHEPAYVSPSCELPRYKANTHTWRCEGRRWTASNDFFYQEGRHE